MNESNLKEIESKAIWYLERYATSSQNLRKYLKRKVMNNHLNVGSDEIINKVIARLEAQKILNDQFFTESKVRSLLNKGWSTKKIGLKLKELGVSEELIDENINNLDGNEEEINLVSAITLVKKRSIGPYRKVEFTDKVKNREFGIMSRAGFSYTISKKVLIDMDKNEIEGQEI